MKAYSYLATCLFCLMAGAAQVQAAPQSIALVGGDIHTVSGAVIRGGTLLIRGDTIAMVGRGLPLPPNTRKVDCAGKIITPGFVVSRSNLGLLEIDLESMSNDAYPESSDPIRAALDPADAINPYSTLIGVARHHGVTSAVTFPESGLITGQGAWFDLADPRTSVGWSTPRKVALFAQVGERGASELGGSRTVAMLRLKEFFDDVKTYLSNRPAFNRRALRDLSASRLDLEAAIDVRLRRIPLIVRAERASDIRAVLAWAQAERIKVAISGAGEAWLVADQLAKTQTPVILDPTANLPNRFERRNVRPDQASVLARAGVKVAIDAASNHNAGNLRFVLGNAVREGMPPELALKAATLIPAEIYGLDKKLGALAKGYRADLVVWSGDPFEPRNQAEAVYIRGVEQPMDSRQTKLARRYLQRHQLKD